MMKLLTLLAMAALAVAYGIVTGWEQASQYDYSDGSDFCAHYGDGGVGDIYYTNSIKQL